MNTRLFWNRVKSRIKEKRLTHKEFVKVVRIPPSTFRNWLYRNINPPLEDANRISQYLGVSLEYLIYGPGKDTVSETREELLLLLKEAEIKLSKIRRNDFGK